MWFLINTKILWIMWIITKLKLKSEILKSVFYKFFYKSLYRFFLYIKISKTLSAKYYQENKEGLQKKTSQKKHQSLSK